MSKSWTGPWRYYGLKQPFDFKVAIPFLLNAIGLLMVIAISAVLFANGGLLVGTERFFFFCYIAAMLVIAIALSRITVVSTTIFLWCATELLLAFGSSALGSYGIGQSLLPKNWFRQAEDPRFVYHPILGLTPKPSWHGNFHWDARNKRLYDEFGWPTSPEFYSGAVFHHNSLGLRGRDLSAEDLTKSLIFADGGSTTYDYNVSQGLTWVERLEATLKYRFTIVNFGAPWHSTSQHLIHTAFYHSLVGKRPVCAMYYVGWNDLLNLHRAPLDPTYANFLTLAMSVRRPELWPARYSPFADLVYIVAKRRLDTVPEIPRAHGNVRVVRSDARLERIFLEHIATIVAINNSRGVKTVFIGQMVNRYFLDRSPHAKSLSEYTENRYVWPLHERFNSILKIASASIGANYIDAGIENFQNGDFADPVHFSEAGSRKFAGLISEEVGRYCQ